MPLIKQGNLVEDPWVFVADEDDLPADRPAVVSLKRWKDQRAELDGRNHQLGVRLDAGDNAEDIGNDVARFDMIALDFPKYTDGRNYSSARLLRERYGFKGELRAVGNVLRDQFQYMHRCGIDSFEVESPTAVDAWLEAVNQIGVWYQPAADGRTTVNVLRHRSAGSWSY